ncbi:MAG: hypothetical protein IAI49_14130, partial [Candidatus Eremiobacteraeota bacterium]|nr:hypothetical protein [Candidatus Eremiobacteraeota bacterium]
MFESFEKRFVSAFASIAIAAIATALPAAAGAAAAPSAPTIAQATPAASATITGAVKTPGGLAIASAKGTLTGPATLTTTTDALGAFS